MPDASEHSTSRSLTDAINRVLDENAIAALMTLIEAPAIAGAKILVREGGVRAGSFGDEALDDAVCRYAKIFLSSRTGTETRLIKDIAPQLTDWSDARIMCERIEPEPRLIVCGAGHVGAALARLAVLLGYDTTLIDDRADFLTRDRFPAEGIKLLPTESWTGALRESIGAGRNVAVAVVTRGHNEDEECMRAVVAARPDYVGLIGSRRRTNIVLDRLRKDGFDEALLNQVKAPIGLDIGAVSPEEVALAILAEIIAERRGAKGGSLSAWRRQPTKRDEHDG